MNVQHRVAVIGGGSFGTVLANIVAHNGFPVQLWLRDETLNGRESFVIERFPQYEHSGYTRQILWLDKEMYQPLQLEFFDRKNSQLKTLQFLDYKQYLDQYWRPGVMQMTNHQNGKSTRLTWSDYKFKNDNHSDQTI